ncbi:MAG: hypothetical protein AAB885_03875, partial [Patescibacteria group bacterium]
IKQNPGYPGFCLLTTFVLPNSQALAVEQFQKFSHQRLLRSSERCKSGNFPAVPMHSRTLNICIP